MIKSTVTTHVCDGCGAEATQPYGWRSFNTIHFGVTFFHMPGAQSSEDYCAECAEKMKLSVKKLIAQSEPQAGRE